MKRKERDPEQETREDRERARLKRMLEVSDAKYREFYWSQSERQRALMPTPD